MNMSLCYWMAVSADWKPGSGPEVWALRVCFLSLLLIVLYVAGTLYKKSAIGTTSVWGRWKIKWLLISEKVNLFLASLKRKSRGFVRHWVMIFMVIWTAGMIYGLSRIRLNVVTEHHVAILREEKDVHCDFAFVSDEDRDGDVFRACPDDKRGGVDACALLRQGVGYIAESATWQERGTCKSILDKSWGFKFKDEKQPEYRRVN